LSFGHLNDGYYSDDVTHGKSTHGALVMDEVPTILGSKRVSHG